MRRAAIYARYSSENQRDESIDAQICAIEDYAKRNNIAIVKTYIDRAKSATTAERPSFQEMIKMSETGLFDTIIVHKLDRFARSKYDSAVYKQKLKVNNVRLLSVTENLDGTPESIILESVLEAMAEYYSKNLAREIMKGTMENAKKTEHCGGVPPLGFDIVDKKLVINQHEAEAVRLIFRLYASGSGYTEIINTLNRNGYRTKRGNSFGKNSIFEILRNEKYKGVYTYNKSSRKSAKEAFNMRSKDNFPISVEGINRDVLTGDISFILSSNYRDSPIVHILKRGELTVRGLNELTNKGFPFMDRSSAETFIQYVIKNEERFPLKNTCHRVGWHEIDNKLCFVHRDIFFKAKPQKTSYSGNLDLSCKGTFDSSIAFFNQVVKKRIGLQAICAVSLSSAIVGMIEEKDLRYVFHIGGMSTTGKTTSLMLAGSMWGNPKISKNGVIRTWNSTQNKLVQSCCGNNGVMIGLDELSMSGGDKTKLIYLLTGGSDKQRMTDEDSADDEFRTVFMSTGEIPMSESNFGGIAVRLFELKNYNLTGDKKTADAIMKNILDNYGHIGYEFAKVLSAISHDTVLNYVQSYTELVIKKIKKHVQQLGKSFSPLYSRAAEKIATILVAAKLAKVKLKMDFDICEIADFLITKTTLLEKGQEQAVNAVERFLEEYNKNRSKFPSSSNDNTNLWGRTVLKDGKVHEIIVLYEQFAKIMSGIGYPDISSLTKSLNEKGFLNCEADKNYSRRKIGNLERAKVIVLDIAAFEGGNAI